MTVDARIPYVEYTGNGVITKFDWDWKMIEDSNINVRVDNIFETRWNLQANSVVFDTAPADGADILIYRLTTLWMPENYRAFGRFHSEKTELSTDRAIMIAQERGGRRGGNGSDGIVGGSDLYIIRGEFDVTVASERGTDALLEMWVMDDDDPPTPGTPDPSIIWAGADILSGVYSLPGNVNGVSATITFRMDLTDGVATEASTIWQNYNAVTYTSWLDADPGDDEYWMRVTGVGALPPTNRYQISDGDNNRSLGEEFQMRGRTVNSLLGPFVSVITFGDAAPSTRTATFLIEICKDGGGAPDENWAGRNVTLEAIYNLEGDPPDPEPDPDPPPDPVDVTGAFTWLEWFGNAFGSTISDQTAVIANDGVSIWFTVPAGETRPIKVNFGSIEVTGTSSLRRGSVNQTVGDYTSAPTFLWGNGTGFTGGINQIGVYDIDLVPGTTYIFSIRNETPATPNWVRAQIHYIDET